MLEEFSQAIFDEYLDSEFQIMENATPVCAFKLSDVIERTKTPTQESFSLMFQGPLEPFVAQGIRRLKHSQLGEMDIFLVPVGKEKDGFQYEAVFNKLLEPGK
jgi:hypothetical protein